MTGFATHHTVLLFSLTLPLEQGFTAVFVSLRYILPLPNEVIELGAVDVASAMPTGSTRSQPMYFKRLTVGLREVYLEKCEGVSLHNTH